MTTPTETPLKHERNVCLAAERYLEQGYAVLPLRTAQKRPYLSSWKEYQETLPSKQEVAGWFERWPNAGVAVVCGWNNLAVVDIDDCDLADRIAEDVELSYVPMVRTPRGGLHLYMKERETSKNGPIVDGVADVKARGGYIVAPPTPGYVWVNEIEQPWVDSARRWGAELLRRNGIDVREERDRSAAASDGHAAVLDGARNTTLTSIGGKLRNQGLDEGDIAIALRLHNGKYCDPPLSESEVVQIARSVARYEPGAKRYALTDLGNAERLVKRYGDDLRYSHGLGEWYVWRGTHWGKNHDGEVERRANETARSIYDEIETVGTDEERKAVFRHAQLTQRLYQRNAMIRMSQDLDGVPVSPADLDKSPWLLNTADCTIDLRSGARLEHQRSDLITRLLPFEFDPNARASRWERFLDRIFGGDEQVISYLKRAIGYSLTGSVREQVLFICHGVGANGKTVFLQTLNRLLGPYAKEAEPDLLMARHSDVHPTGIADLFGARLVTTNETSEGRSFDERKLKWLTGGDRLKARFMRQDYFEFEPTHKLWMATNHRPAVTSGGPALWRRINLIPFDVVISKEEQDPDLPQKLLEEAPGILAWAVEGAKEWAQQGLRAPLKVRNATELYEQETDWLGQFISDVCELSSEGRVTTGLLYRAYKAWCIDSNESPLTQNLFSQKLRTWLGHAAKHESSGNVWEGISVIGEEGEPSTP